MKTIIISMFVFLAVTLLDTPAVNAVDEACKITDSAGLVIRSPDCFGALLRVETDKFIYVHIRPEGFVESNQQNSSGPHLYFTAPGCQGEPLFYSAARSMGYFFEAAQYVNETHFWYAEWKAVTTGGSAILSYYDQHSCYDSTGWWDDSTVFAPLAFQLRNKYRYEPPFKLSR